jgi:Tfp pilus assembly protein PilN
MLQTPLPAPPAPEAIIVSTGGGGPTLFEAVAICVVAVSFAFVAYKVLMPLVRAFAARIEGRGTNPALEQRVSELQQQLQDADALQHRVAELEERLDFAERLLSQRDEPARLPAEGGRS